MHKEAHVSKGITAKQITRDLSVTYLAEGAALSTSKQRPHSQRDTIATMSRSTSKLAQRQELRRLLAQYPTLLSREGPGDEYLVGRKIANASSKRSCYKSTEAEERRF